MTRLRRFGPLLAVIALLAGAAIAATLATPQITSVPTPRAPDVTTPPPATAVPPSMLPANPPGQVQQQHQLPGWVSVLISVLCVCLVAAIVGLVVWMLLREAVSKRRGRLQVDEEHPTPAGARDKVLAAVDAGLSDLDATDTDPRRAVIGCWIRLEEAAAAAGTPREPGDSPTDLVLRLLAAHQVSSGVLYPLAELYRLARYATHTVDTGMRDRARYALRQLRAELAREPAMGTSK
jgi:hypothetical protein